MELWIPLAIGAAFLQNVRSSLQKHLKGQLSTGGATFSRFVFGVPMALCLLVLLVANGATIPSLNPRFMLFAATGGLSQILATFLLVHLFGLRNFAVGTTLSKTETIQAAIFGVILLGDNISVGAAIAIIVSLLGVILLSTPNGIRGGLLNRSSLIGMASGTAFAVSGVSYRAASLSLETGDFMIRSALTLVCVIIFQTLVMAFWLRKVEAGQIRKVFSSWRISAFVGISGALASFGWFCAMTLQNAAYVKALGQIEILFTIAVSVLYFRERIKRREALGIFLACAGILILLLWRQ